MNFKRSGSGMYWDVVFNGIFIKRFDTRKECKEFISTYSHLVENL